MSKIYPGFGQPGYAEFPIELLVGQASTAAVGEDDLVEMIASTETPMERYGMDPGGNWGRWREQLDHSAGAVQLGRIQSGRAPVLMEHFRTEQVGVIKTGKLDSRKLRLVTRFSNVGRGPEIRQDVLDKIRGSVSLGWFPKAWKLMESNAAKGDLWRITEWEPFEVSMVSVPANPDARVASNAGGVLVRPLPIVVRTDHEEGVSAMIRRNQHDTGDAGAPGATAAAKAPAERALVIEIPDEPNPARQARADAAAIFAVANQYGCAALAPKWIEDGLTVDQARSEILKRVRTVSTDSPKPNQASATVEAPTADRIGLSKKDRERYSYARAVLLGAGEASGGLEADVHLEIKKQLPFGWMSRGGLMVPMDLRSEEEKWLAGSRRAALDSKTLTKGSEIVFEQPGELIELLRNRTVVLLSGAQSLSGLTGPVQFPKQTGAMTMVWVGENPASPVAPSDLALGMVTLSPKTLMGTTSYSRQLLQQASLDVENLVRNDFALAHAIALDRAAIHGLGVGGEPTGVYVSPGVNSQAMGGVTPTYILLVNMAALVADDNADQGSLGWITTPLMAGKLKTTPEHPTVAFANWIWQGNFRDGMMAGYPARGTNNVSKTMTGTAGATTGGSDHGIVFGNWADMLVGLFATLELIPDPFTKKTSGMIEVASFQMADVIVRHGESFARSTGATLS